MAMDPKQKQAAIAKEKARRVKAKREAAVAERARRREARREAERRVVERWAKRRDPEQIATDTGVSLAGPKDRGDGESSVRRKKRRKNRHKKPRVREILTGFETNRRKH